MHKIKKGKIILAQGPMFSGKTTWLIDTLEKYPSENVLAVRFFKDTRYSTDSITSHDHKKLKAITAKNDKDILDALIKSPNIKIIGVDELQFFLPSIAGLFTDLKKKGLDVFIAGLNVDHNNKVWEATKETLKVADTIYNFKAICAICGKKNATITNRKGRRNERVVVGGMELYESLCKKDYYLKVSL